jgi:glycosyltransferase involved in cell wall biosynthesis
MRVRPTETDWKQQLQVNRKGTMSAEKKLKVLMELRPCLEGFAGIPQETRLVFHALNKMDNVEPIGLINHSHRNLWPGLKKRWFDTPLPTHRRVKQLSKMVLSVKHDPFDHWLDRFKHAVSNRTNRWVYGSLANLGVGMKVYDFDAADFEDFIWQAAFSKSLPASERSVIHRAKYASMIASWDMLNRVAIGKAATQWAKLPQLSTKNHDVFLAQTPCPINVSPNTQLVVRYHDAIPVFLPHTISSPQKHQGGHMAALHQNQKRGIFACTSNATREDLLKIYPSLESRAVVIPDIVSHEYYQETASREYINNVIRNNICVDTEPKFLTSREKENFYQKHLMSKPQRFILMVSTLEPRKNHAKLVGAWDYLKNHGMPDLKLVVVGTPGWDFSRILDSMAAWQQRGELFHLQRVSASQLRLLYNAADAVVCPSVAEGFDLSGIEAMLCGGAVVASDIPVHREIYQDACEYFDPYSTIAQAKAIESIITPEHREKRQALVAAGLVHAQRYRAENITPLWHDFFERIKRREFSQHPTHRRTESFGTAFPLPEQTVSE